MPRPVAEVVAIACLALVVLLAPPVARPHRRTRREDAQRATVAHALARIAQSVDPCGETDALRALLDRLEDCGYDVRTSATADRNLFDRSTIVWNPGLRSELEPSCDGDPSVPVVRDPTASLLHELVHAADECDGRNPGEHELDAVRIENVYRRAAGLCQRTGYGDEPLPAPMRRRCGPAGCDCAIPGPAADPELVRPVAVGHQAADSAPAGADVEPAR